MLSHLVILSIPKGLLYSIDFSSDVQQNRTLVFTHLQNRTLWYLVIYKIKHFGIY
jgi:hypothetical protein